MQNNLYFLPSIDAGDQKKTFFFFEWAHAGYFKSDQVGTTDRAVGIIKSVLEESARNIVIDTSTNSGRNLLSRVLPLMQETGGNRLFLASLFRQHCAEIQKYWEKWGTAPVDERKYHDDHFTKLFGTARTLGGMRPLTAIDRLAIQAWQHGDIEVFEPAFAAELLKHPTAMFLKSLVQALRERSKYAAQQPEDAYTDVITSIVYCLCRLVQDPFPLADADNSYRQVCFCLFDDTPPKPERIPSGIASPENLIFEIMRGQGRDRNWLKQKHYPLWLLIIQTRKFLDKLTGNSSRGGVDVSNIFQVPHPFERRMLHLFDQIIYVWAEALIPSYADNTLQFVDHEVFTKKLAALMLAKCKDFLEK